MVGYLPLLNCGDSILWDVVSDCDSFRIYYGPEFAAKAVRDWLKRLGVGPLFIGPGSPWENGYIESFNGKLRYGLLDGEIFMTLKEAQVVIEQWRSEYNQIRPHSSLGYKPPAPRATLPENFANTLTHEVVQ